MMKRNTWIVIISALILVFILGSFLLNPLLERIDAQFYPRFHPGIWDQPVIRPPENSTVGLTDYPFMFRYNLTASTGFASAYKKYYRPTFVIIKGRNATIVLDVFSATKHPVTVTLAAVDDLPAGGISFNRPDSIVIGPGDTRQMDLELFASPKAGLPEIPESGGEEAHQYPVGVWLRAENWSVGQGFYLRVA
ncbi:MAG: hypothetical protein WC586_11870 [Methanoregula sp.]